MFRKNVEQPSEIGTPETPSIWVAIRRKNREREHEQNRGTPPKVINRPENWVMLVTGVLLWHHVNVVFLLFR